MFIDFSKVKLILEFCRPPLYQYYIYENKQACSYIYSIFKL